MAAGADSVAVTGLGLASVPAQVLVTVRKATGGLNLFATVRGDSITTDGFTADLSAATDAATYVARLPGGAVSWTLRDANGVEQSAAGVGRGASWRATRVNQQADTVTFRAAGRGSDADPLFALRLDGAAFPGRDAVVLRARGAGAGARDGQGGGPALSRWRGRGGTWRTWFSSRRGN